MSSVIVVVLGLELLCCNTTLPIITAVAADRPAIARLVAVAQAGRSAASYTITGDTTAAAAKSYGESVQSLEKGAIGAVFGELHYPSAEKIGIEIGLINSGRTASVVADIFVVFDYGKELLLTPNYQLAEDRDQRYLNTTIIPTHPAWFLDEPFFFRNVEEVFCYGRIRYADIFNRRWTYGFSVKISPNKAGIYRCPSVGTDGVIGVSAR